MTEPDAHTDDPLRRRADCVVVAASCLLFGVPFLLLVLNALGPVELRRTDDGAAAHVWRFTAPTADPGANWLDAWAMERSLEEVCLPQWAWSRRPGHDQLYPDKRNLPMHFAPLKRNPQDPNERPRRPDVKDVLKDRFIPVRFGLRSLLIDLGATVKLDLFGISSSARVVLGRRTAVPAPGGRVRDLRWLFIKSRPTVPREMRRDLPFEPPELDALVAAFARNSRAMRRLGIPYVVVVCPNKASIYPERLPGWIRPTDGRSRLDQLLAALAELPADRRVDVVDLRPAILAAKRAEAEAAAREGRPPRPLYQLFDTHWADLAAFPAYRAIVEHLAARYPAICGDLAPLGLDEMRCAWSEEARPGDLSTFLHRQDDPAYREHLWEIVPRTGTGNAEEGRVIPVIDTGTGDSAQPTALVLRDSFCQRLVPYLSLHFEAVRYRWHNELLLRVKNPEGEMVVFSQHLEEWKSAFGDTPDLVVQQLVERWLVDDPFVFADREMFPPSRAEKR